MALESILNNPQNCYLIFYKNKLVGSTRYYEYNFKQSSIKIGYTFYAKWDTELNRKVKKLMLDYAFEFVDDVFFDAWDKNFHSQKAVAKLGAKIYNRDVTRNKLIF